MKDFFAKFKWFILGVLSVFSFTVYAAIQQPSFTPTLVPLTDNTYDLGTSTKKWRNIYIQGSDGCLTLTSNLITPSGVACGSGGGGSGTGTISTSTPLVSGQVDFSTGVSTIGNDSTFLFDTTGKKLTASYASTTGFSTPYASSTSLFAGSFTLSTTSAGCAAFMATGLLVSTGTACGSGGAGTPGGNSTNIQFNNAGSFGGSDSFVWTGSRVGIGSTTPLSTLGVKGAAGTMPFLVSSSTDNPLFEVDQSGTIGVASSTAWGLLSLNADALGVNVPSFVIGSSSKTDLIVTNGGRLGLGMTNPISQLSLGFVNNASTTTAVGGINLGDSSTNLYRSGASVITTDAGTLRMGGSTTAAITSSTMTANSGSALTLSGNRAAATVNTNIVVTQNLASTFTSGTGSILQVTGGSFAPTTGTGQMINIDSSPTVNQTGSASGITRGLRFDANCTRCVDFRALETTSYTNNIARATSTVGILFNQVVVASTTAVTVPNAFNTIISGPPIASTNVTLSTSTGLMIGSPMPTTFGTGLAVNSAGGTVSNAYGLQVFSPTGATNNYTATFLSGNVGIGSSTPSFPLSVIGNEYHNGNFYQFGDTPTNDPFYCNTTTKCFNYTSTDNTNAGTFFEVGNPSTGANAYTGYCMSNSIFDTAGTYYNCNTFTGSNYNNATFGTALNFANQTQMVNNIPGKLTIGAVNAAGSINFLTGGAVDGTNERVTITSGGNVGIASSTPTRKLSVGGQSGIASSSIAVAEYSYGATGNNATSTAMTISPATSNKINIPIGTSATTITLCNFQPGETVMITIRNPASTAGALTFAACSPLQLGWANRTGQPTQTTTANGGDIYSFTASQAVGSTSPNIIQVTGAQTPNVF